MKQMNQTTGADFNNSAPFLFPEWRTAGPVRSPVSWIGNKSPVLKVLYALFPPKFDRIIDVFGGSGSVLLGRAKTCPFEVYNDFNGDLVNLFRCMRDRPMAVVRELGFLRLNAREDFVVMRRFLEQQRFDDVYLAEEMELTEILLPPPSAKELAELMFTKAGDHDVRRAVIFLKALRYSYSSSGKSFACQPFDIMKLCNQVWEVSDRLADAVVENQDFEVLTKHYDREKAFFYYDPPYLDTESMYKVAFGWEDHMRLYHTMCHLKGRGMISYNDCRTIREIYKDFYIFDFKRVHSMRQRTEAGAEFPELLICNYDPYERAKASPQQQILLEDDDFDYEKILKGRILPCKTVL